MARLQEDRLLPWAVAVGAGAGVSAAAFTVLRLVRRRRAAAVYGTVDRLEEAAVDALRRDRVTGSCAIDVTALGPGIIELSGAVPTAEVGQRAARLLHALEGVRTVVNRLQAGSYEQRLAENRVRHANGEPGLRDRRWYGVSAGMGRRRQSTATDPDRPDDKAERLAGEMDMRTTDIADAASAETLPGGDEALQH